MKLITLKSQTVSYKHTHTLPHLIQYKVVIIKKFVTYNSRKHNYYIEYICVYRCAKGKENDTNNTASMFFLQ